MINHNIPFGGVGESGFGKCHGRFGFDTFSYYRGVMAHTTDIDPMIRYPPWTPESIPAYVSFIHRTLLMVYYFLQILFDIRSYPFGKKY